MEYGAADDIVLRGPGMKNQKKKGKAGKIVFLLFLLIVILGGAAAGYWYYINYMKETPKDVFLEYVGKNNFNSVLDLNIYYDMLEQLTEKSFLSETTASFSTTKKNDLINNIDTSKCNFNFNISSDKESKKTLIDGKMTYSSNDLFAIKLLSTQNAIGLYSEEIYDKYIASTKSDLDESLKKSTGLETNLSTYIEDDKIEEFTKNKIELDDAYKLQKATEYMNTINELIPEEAVTQKENIIVTIDSETINANAYTLNLDKDNYQKIAKSVLEKLKNDDELLSKIVSGEEKNSNKNTVNEEGTNTIKENVSENIAPITTITNIQTEYVEGETENHQTEVVIDGDSTSDLEMMSTPETDLVKESNLKVMTIPEKDLVKESDLTTEEFGIYQNLISAVILGKKIDCTLNELKSEIDEELSNISSIKDGITITVYVRNEENKPKETIKLYIEASKNTSLDIEYKGDTKFKITYLSPDKDENGKEFSGGISFEVEKKSSDVNEKYNVQYNEIKNEKVVSKTQIDLQTNNGNPSKGYTNSIIINSNNSDGDLKININNEIKFQEETISEEFNDDNTVYLDRLSNEEAENLYKEIMSKVMTVYLEKIANLNFIDSNSSNSIIQQPEANQINLQEKEEIKNKLIEKVSTMMGEAQARGETFTIQNLVDLTIEGYDVSSIVSDSLATIKVNGYTFNIDKDFMLSD